MVTLDDYRKALDALLITNDDFIYTVDERGASAVYIVHDRRGREIGRWTLDADRQTVNTENKAAAAVSLPLPDGTRHYSTEYKRLAREFDYLCTQLNERIETRRRQLEAQPTTADPATAQPEKPTRKTKDSGHYNYSPQGRKEIVEEYRAARATGNVTNKNAWAQLHGVSGKTLLKYEREFPEEA